MAVDVDIIVLGFAGLSVLMIMDFLLSFVYIRRLVYTNQQIYRLQEAIAEVIAQLAEGAQGDRFSEIDVERLKKVRESLSKE